MTHERTKAMNDRKYVIMGDTDSSYVHLGAYVRRFLGDENAIGTEEYVKLADLVQERIKNGVERRISGKFLIPVERTRILVPGREIVGDMGLFKQAKKRYAIHVVDDEGKRVDKIKYVGLEVKRSDTPKIIQDFLKKVIESVLKHKKGEQEIRLMVKEFVCELKGMDPLELGITSRASNMEDPNNHYYAVTAAKNTNKLIDMHGERNMDKISSGDKVKVMYVKHDLMPCGMKAVAFNPDAHIPKWFRELPFDIDKQIDKIMFTKLELILTSVLGWELNINNMNSLSDLTGEDSFFD